jgi:hypothetical protein
MEAVEIDHKSYEMPPRDGFTVTHFIIEIGQNKPDLT